MSDDEVIQAADVLKEEHRLALDGYHLRVEPVEMGATLAHISLMTGQRTIEQTALTLDDACPSRDESVLEAILGFLNSGGSPQRLMSMMEVIVDLPQISPDDYTILGSYGTVEWVSYYQHNDGRLFEVKHGLGAWEMTQEDLDAELEALMDVDAPVVHAPAQPVRKALGTS